MGGIPSGGENFGHSIAEALSVGVPVLLSYKTPWYPADFGAGASYPLQELHLFSSFIDHFDISSGKFFDSRNSARLYYERFCDLPACVDQHQIILFNSFLS